MAQFMPPIPRSHGPVTRILGRYLGLMTGMQYRARARIANVLAQHAAAQPPEVGVKLQAAIKMLQDRNKVELAKVWGTRLGTGAVIGGGIAAHDAVKESAERRKPRRSMVAAGLGLGAMGVAAGIPALRGVARRVPLYGAEIARAAKTHGIVSVIPRNLAEDDLGKSILHRNKINRPDAQTRILNHTLHTGTVNSAGNADQHAVVVDAFMGAKSPNRKVLGATADTKARNFADNKLNQVKLLRAMGFGHFAPPTLRGSDLERHYTAMMAKGKPFTYNDLIQAHYGDKRYVAKQVEDTAGFVVDGRKRNVMVGGSQDLRGTPFREIARNIDNAGGMSDVSYIVQQFDPTQQFGKVRQALYREGSPMDKLRNRWLGELYGEAKIPNAVEFRLHVVNGRVIPYATTEKWDPLQYGNPLRTFRKAKIEAELQKFFDKVMVSDHPLAKKFQIKDQVFGMDVGIRPDGTPIIYEMNPTMGASKHYGSGQLLFPWTRDAIHSAIKGTLPMAQKVQLAGSGLATAGGAGLVRRGLTGQPDPRA